MFELVGPGDDGSVEEPPRLYRTREAVPIVPIMPKEGRVEDSNTNSSRTLAAPKDGE